MKFGSFLGIAATPPSSSRKVLLVGRDAAYWKVIHPLLDAGKMPHFARLTWLGILAIPPALPGLAGFLNPVRLLMPPANFH